MENLQIFEDKLDEIKVFLIGEIKSELKRANLSEGDVFDLDCQVDAHCPGSGAELVQNIEVVYSNPENDCLYCGCSLGNSEDRECLENVRLSGYDCETLLKVLQQMRNINRKVKLEELMNIVQKCADRIVFDGNFTFEDTFGDHKKDGLTKLEFNNDKLVVFYSTEDGEFDAHSDIFPDCELDRILEYVKQESEKFINVSLTDEQKQAVEDFKQAIQTLESAGVVVLCDVDNEVIEFFNGNGVTYDGLSCNYAYGQLPKGCYNVQAQIEKNPRICAPNLYYGNNGEEIVVKRK